VELAGLDIGRLADRVRRRMEAVGAADQAAYVEVLRARPAETGRLGSE